MTQTPYSRFPSHCFWRDGVVNATWAEMPNLYVKKFELTRDCRIASAGSCFAQHISRSLNQNGFRFLDVEPSPPGLTSLQAQRYGYGIFSARYGNIYVVRHLLQLATEALGTGSKLQRVWQHGDRFFDALRPTVEPLGLDSSEEVVAHRAQHIENVRRLFLEMDVFIFTLGLTEAWVERETGLVFPSCPGVVAGHFDPCRYRFKNFGYSEILSDFIAFRDLIQKARQESENAKNAPRYILTVSPVPLVATATGSHALTATVHSKSILRAVAGELAAQFQDIDYFPSYEILASPWSQTNFYKANLRDPTSDGVNVVMNYFFRAHGALLKEPDSALHLAAEDDADPFCDEAIIEAIER